MIPQERMPDTRRFTLRAKASEDLGRLVSKLYLPRLRPEPDQVELVLATDPVVSTTNRAIIDKYKGNLIKSRADENVFRIGRVLEAYLHKGRMPDGFAGPSIRLFFEVQLQDDTNPGGRHEKDVYRSIVAPPFFSSDTSSTRAMIEIPEKDTMPAQFHQSIFTSMAQETGMRHPSTRGHIDRGELAPIRFSLSSLRVVAPERHRRSHLHIVE